MATTFFLYFFNTFTLFFLLSPPCSLSLKTTTFDVSSSLQQTQNLFSDINSQNTVFDAITSTPTSPSHFLLPLHSRFSLYKNKHSNYTSLTLYRLARDSDRVNSLASKLNSASDKIKTTTSKESLRTPVTSGMRQGSGEYFTRIGIGTPAKQYYMVIDTGSDVSWLQCQPCSDCYQQSDPIFNPTDSSTYATISCDSPQCKSLDLSSCSFLTDTCLYQVGYGDGSTTVGDFTTETVSFGNSGKVPNVAIGCGHDNEGLFSGAAGLIGLGGDALSLPSQIKAKSISYCLVNRDSTDSSTLEFNSPHPSDSVTVPLLRNSKMPTFFYVGMTGISVGEKPISIPPESFKIHESGKGGIILDSGTAVTRLPTQVYNSLRDSFVRATKHFPPVSKFEIFDTCYNFGAVKKVDVPTVSFHFAGGKTMTLKAYNYMVPVDGTGKFCFAFAPTSRSPSIIGNVQQQGTRVSYDIANSLVAFSPDKC